MNPIAVIAFVAFAAILGFFGKPIPKKKKLKRSGRSSKREKSILEELRGMEKD